MPKDLPKKQFVRISEAAKILGVSIDTVRRWNEAGKLRSIRVGTQHRYFRTDEILEIKNNLPLTVSETAHKLGISITTLRRIENKGLITAQRNSRGERAFSPSEIQRYQALKKAKKLSLPVKTEEKQENSVNTPEPVYISSPFTYAVTKPTTPVDSFVETEEVESSPSDVETPALEETHETVPVLKKQNPLFVRLQGSRNLIHSLPPVFGQHKREFVVLSSILLFSTLTLSYTLLGGIGKTKASINLAKEGGGRVLAESTQKLNSTLTFNIPVIFNQPLNLNSNLFVKGTSLFTNDITVQNGDVNVGTGNVFASNLVYSVTAGDGIAVAGDQNLTITNTDPGSAQKIFNNIVVGGNTISADNNQDALTFEGGNGVSVSSTGKTITISGTTLDSGWVNDNGIVHLKDETDSVGIGTDTPQAALDVLGDARISGTLTLAGVTYTFPSSAGSNGNVLVTNGSGGLSWVDLSTEFPSITNYWRVGNGALFPANTTQDFLIGGNSSASAKFAFLNDNSGTPVASFSGNLVLNGPYSIQTTNKQPLTLGGDNTGNVIINGGLGGGVDIGNNTKISGNLIVTSTTTTGALTIGSETLTSISGNGITTANNNLSLNLLDSASSTGDNSSFSGLQFSGPNNQLALLQGCSNGQILKWNNTDKVWACSIDLNTLGVPTVQEGGVTISNDVNVLNFNATDFNINEAPSGTANINLDYASSKITRADQNETITGNWIYSSATPITFTSTNTALAIPNSGSLAITDGTNTLLTIADAGSQADLSGIRNLSAGGTITFSGLGTGIVHSSSGVLSTSLVNLASDVTGVLPSANGGTGTNLSTAATGSIPYFSSTGVMSALPPSSSGFVLTTNGPGNAPTWTSTGSVGTNYFQKSLGAIAPLDITNDLLLGSSATASALVRIPGTSGAATFFTGGNVGIGLTNPGATLEVSGSLTSSGTITFTDLSSGGVVHADTSGHLSVAKVMNSELTNSSIGLAADTGTGSVDLGSTLTINGTSTQGIATSVSGGIMTITASNASATQKGVASFNNGNFVVTTGAVNLTTTGVTNDTYGDGGNGVGQFTVDAFGRITDASNRAINVGTSDITGTLANGHGGTGLASIGTANQLLGVNAGGNALEYKNLSSLLSAGTGISLSGTNTVTVAVASDVPTSVTNDTNVTGSISGNVLTLGWTGTLGTDRGGTGMSSYNEGDLLYGNSGGTLSALPIGSSTQILTVSGGVPVWSDVGSTINFFQRNDGSIAPLNVSDDFLLGSAATSSALVKFSGTVGGDSFINTGNFGIGTTTPGAALEVNGAGIFASGLTVTSGTVTLGDLASGGVVHADTSGNLSVAPVTNGELSHDSITITTSTGLSGGGTVALGGSLTLTNAGVTSLNGLTGGLSIDNSSQSGTTITINDASTTAKGIAQFDSSNFSDNGSGTINLATTGVTNGTYGDSGNGVSQFTVDTFGRITSASSRAIDLSTADVTGALGISNGGTNTNSIGSAGSIPYSNGSAYAFSSAGTTGQALLSGGTGSPTFTTGTLTLGGNFTVSGSSALTLTTTGVTNVTLPTTGTLATLAGTEALTNKTVNGLSLTSNSDGFSIAGGTTSRTLTVTGGNVSLNQSLLTSSSPTFNAPTVTSLTIGSDLVSNIVGSGLQLSGGTLSTTLGTSVDLTSEVTGILPIANGGTNSNATPTAGGISYGTGSAFAFTSAGTTGYLLTSAGSGTPTWTNPADLVAANAFFQENAGVVSPKNITDDLAIGGTSTSSALFQVSGTTGEITATNSISGLTGITSSGTIDFSDLGTGIVKSTGGTLGLATAGTDYEVPLTFSTGLNRSGNTVTNTGVLSLNGTTNQVSVDNTTGDITLSLPQDINTTSSPTFNGLTLSSLTRGSDTITDFTGTGLQMNSGSLETTLGTSVDLTSEVTGILPIANGGTGANTLANLIALGTDTTGNYVATITGNTQISVSGSGSENAGVSLSIGANSIGDSQLAFDTGQTLTTSSSPTFNAPTVTSLTIGSDLVSNIVGSGLQLSGGTLSTTLGTSVDLTSEVTGILPIANGGTNSNATPTAGGISYGTGSAFAFTSAGTTGQILSSNGSSAPSWINSSSLNFFQRNSGAIAPLNISDDLLIGGTSTSSALVKFSGTSGNNSYINNGNVGIGNTNPQYTLDVTGTGNISEATTLGSTLETSGLATFDSGINVNSETFTDLTGTGLSNLSGVLTNSGVLSNIAGTGISLSGGTGNVTITNTGVISFQGNTGAVTLTPGSGIGISGTTISNSGVLSLAGTTNQISVTGSTGNITLSLPQDIDSGASPEFAGLQLSGLTTGIAHVGSDGTISSSLVDLTADVTGKLPIANGGTNSNATPTAGGLAYGTGSAYAFTSAGTTGYLLTSGGSGTPTWTNPADLVAANAFFQENAGIVSPKNITDDLAIGGTSTSSALFQVSGTTGEITASSSISGLTGITSSGTIDFSDLGTGIVKSTGGTLGLASAGTDYEVPLTFSTGLNRSGNTVTNTGVLSNVAGTGISVSGGTGDVTISNTGVLSLNGTTNQVSVDSSTGNITLSLPQDIDTGASPEFTGLTLSGLSTNGIVTVSGGVLGSESKLSIAQGGTNSTATPTAGGIAYGTGSAYAFSSAGTTGQALLSGGTGSPTFTTGTLSLAHDFSVAGSSALTLTTTGVTNVTLPTTGTLATLAGTEALTNKTVNGLSLTSNSDGFSIAGGTTSRTLTVTGGNVSLNQSLLTSSSPTFNAPTVTSLTIGSDLVSNIVGSGLQLSGGTLSTTLGTSVDLTSEVTGILPIANGGTNSNATPTAGGLAYGDGASYQFTNAGTLGYLLTSGAAGEPTWTNPADLVSANELFQENAGVVSPKNITDDLAIGGTSTSSALFQVSGTTGEITASSSISGLTGITSSGTIDFSDLGTGIVKSTGGTLGLASAGTDYQTPLVAGTDYEVPLTFNNGLTRSTNTIGLGGTLSSDTIIALGGNNFSFTGTGNIGIGTSNPLAKLDVNGTASVSGNLVLAGGARTISTTAMNSLTLGNSSTGNVQFYSSSNYIDSLGNLTLAGAITAGSTINGTALQTGSSTRIDGSGNLTNIGTTQFAGQVYTWPTSPSLSSNLVLTTDGSGHLTWTTVSGAGGNSGTITAIGDVTTGDAFTAAGTAGTSLFFADSGSHGQLTIGTLSGDQTYTLPDQSGVICLDTGNCAGSGSGITGVGTINYIAKFNSTGSITSSSIFDNGTSVGIGTSTPVGLFNVEGAVTGKALAVLNQTGSQAIFTASSSGTTKFTIQNNGDLTATGAISGLTGIASSGNIDLSSLSTGGLVKAAASTGRLSLATAGTDYQTPLTAGTDYEVPLTFNNGLTRSTNTIGLGGTLSSATTIALGGNNFSFTGTGNIGIGTSTPIGLLNVDGAATGKALAILNQTGNQAIFTASKSGSTKFIIDNAGNVGIGTAAPTEKLQVAGNILVTGGNNVEVNSGGQLQLNNPVSNNNVYISNKGASGQDLLTFGLSAGSSEMVISNSGNVGIGTTNPLSLFSVGSSSQFQVNSSGAIAAATGITSSGTVTFSSLSAGGIVKANTSGALSLATAGTDYEVPLTFSTGLNRSGNTVTNTGVLSLAGTNNQVSVDNTTGDITLSLPQDIDTGASPEFAGLQLSGLSTGIAHIDGSGVISSSLVDLTADVTGKLPVANGGTNANTIGSAGSIAYSNGSSYAFTSAGTTGYLLTSGGSGTPTWTNPADLVSANELFQENAGVVSPKNITDDLAIGGTSTSSALFQVSGTTGEITAATGITSSGTIDFSDLGTGIVKSSGGTLGLATAGTDYEVPLTFSTGLNRSGNTVTNTGVLSLNGTTNQVSVDNTTGDITLSLPQDINTGASPEFTGLQLSGLSTGIAHIGSDGTISSSLVDLTSDVTGMLPVANGGTGANTLANLISLGTDTTGNYVATITGNSQISVSGSGSENAGVSLSIGANSIGDSQLAFDTGQSLTTSSSPTFNAPTVTSITIGSDLVSNIVGSGLQLSGGTLSTTLGTSVDLTSEVTGILPIANGGTNSNATPTAGGISYGTGSAFAFTSAGTTGYLLTSGGSGTPTWTNPADLVAANSFFQENAGVVSPKNITDDLAIGGTSTSSALFQVSGTTGEITASSSISGLTGIASSGNIDLSSLSTGGLVKAAASTGRLSLATAGTDYQTPLTFTNGLTDTTGTVTLGGTLSSATTLANGGNTFAITGTGNIGIGTSTPGSFKLNVNGNTNVTGTLTTTAAITAPTSSNTINGLVINSGAISSGTGIASSGNIDLSALSAGGLVKAAATTGRLSVATAGTDYEVPLTFSTGLNRSGNTITNTGVLSNIAGDGISVDNAIGDVTISNSGVLSLAGTTNQISVTGSTGNITLSLPQDIDTSASPEFAGLTLSGLTSGQFVKTTTGGALTTEAAIDLTSEVTGILPIANGGTNSNATPTAGGISYGTGSAFAFTSAGTTGYLLTSGGSGTPTWTNPADLVAANSFFQENAGVVSPKNITDDLAIGGTSTSSALFQVSGTTGEITASSSISGLTGIASSGNIDLSSLSTGGLVKAAASTGRLSLATAGTDYQTPLTFTNGLTDTTGTVTLGGTLSSATTLANGGNTFAITGTGNIGIGTSTPGSFKLNVNGNTNVTGTLTTTAAITAPTSSNTINGLVINSGAISSGTGIASSGNIDLSALSAGGLVKAAATTGRLSVATAGTDYEVPLTFSTGLNRSGNTITNTGVLSNIAGDGISVDNAIGDVTISNSGVLSLAGTTNQISVTGSTGNITLSLPQDIDTSASPEFAGLTLSGLTSGQFVKTTTGGALTTEAAIDLTSEVTGILPIANGGTNSNATPTAGGISYGTGSAFAFTSAGTTGQILSSNGSSAPSWINSSSLNFFQRNSGAIAPLNISDDLLIGNSATSSALVRLPGLTNQDAFFNLGTGNLGIGLTNPTHKLDVSGTANISGATTLGSTLNVTGAITAPTSSNTINGLVINSGAISSATGLASSGNIDLSALSSGGLVKAAASTGRLSVATAGTDYEVPLTFNNGLTRTSNTIGLGGTLSSATTIALGGNNFMFTGTGNIGIGTSLPGQLLDVNGTENIATNLLFTKEINHTIQLSDSTTSNTAGSALTIQGAAGNGTGTGGTLSLAGGAGGSGAATGGDLILNSGAGGGTSGNSGAITIQPGTVTSGSGGTLNLLGRNGTGGNVGSTINITAGGITGTAIANAGSVNITAGSQTAGNHNAGSVALTAGNSIWQGGNVSLTAGNTTGNSRSGGTISLTAGSGNVSGAGGALTLTGGTAGTTGAGGALSFTTGAGGSTSGNSGALTLGTGTTTSGSFGTISVKQGANTRLFIDATGNMGIGNTSPTSFFNIGSSSQFQVDSSGIITAAAGITSSGTITFSGLSTGVVQSSSGVLSGGALNLAGGSSYITGLLPTANGGTGLDTSAATGVPYISSGTWNTETKLAISRGGTNSTATPTAGGIAYGTGSAYAFTSAGTSGYLLTSNGSGTPTWTDPATLAGSSFWQENAGAVAPKNISDDVLIGNTATASAFIKFAGLSGGDSYINNGNFGIGTTTPGSFKLNVNGNTNVTGTLNVTGAITAPTSSNTINGLVINSGAISSGTGIASSGNIDLSSLSSGGLVKAAASTGRLSVATAGTDYEVPLTFNNGLTRTSNTISLGGTLTGDTDIALGGNDLTFSGTGNVGIGTTTPLARLQIGDTTADTTNQLILGQYETASQTFLPVIQQKSVFTSGTGNDLALGAQSSDGGILFYTGLAGTQNQLGSGSNDIRMVITDAGNVGIGNTNPTSGFLLDVNGGIRGTNGLTITSGTISLPAGSIANSALAHSSFTAAGDSGSGAINLGETFTIAGGTGLTSSYSGGTLTINGDDATTSTKGIASFASANFSVTSGAVSITTGGVGATELASTSVTAGTYGNTSGSGAGYFTVDTDGRLTAAGNRAINVSNGDITGIMGTTNGGTGLSSYTTGDLIYSSATNTLSKLAVGTNGKILQVVSGTPQWVDAGTAGITDWQRNAGAVSPYNITDALNIGGVATSSALVHFAGTAGDNSFINNGNFGIGTTAPAAALDVVGNIQNLASTNANPTELGSTTTDLSNPASVAISGKYAYVVDSANNSLTIFDISNPSSPTAVSTTTSDLNQPKAVAVAGRYAYIGNWFNGNLVVFDISNPASPTEMGKTSIDFNGITAIAVSGKYVYTTKSFNSTFNVYDVSNPSSPIQVFSTASGLNQPQSLAISGRYAYIGNLTSDGLVVYDISNPLSPVKVGSTTTGLDTLVGLSVSGRYAYVADETHGLVVIDISDPTSPTNVGSTTTGLSFPQAVTVAGRYAYVVDGSNNSLVTFDVSDPTSPTEVGSSTSSLSNPTSVAVSGKYAFVTSLSNSSLVTFDIHGIETTSILAHSAEVGTLTVDSNANIANNLSIGGGLNVGIGGIYSDGGFSGSNLNITGAPVGKALSILNYTGTDQNILTASSSGTTKFTLDKSGNIGLAAGANIDTLTAGTLTIGGSTQTGLTLGRSGQSTTLAGNVQAFTLAGAITGSGTPNITGIGQFSGATGVFSTSATTPLVIGGTTATSGLSLQSTSGTGTTDFIKFLVGSNGGTEAMRIIHSGSVGIGNTNPSSLLSVGSTSQFQVNSSGAIAAATGITSSGTVTFSGLASGLVKATSGVLSIATAGTDFENPLTFGNGLTRSTNAISLGGTLTGDTTIALASNDFSFTGTGNIGIGTSTPVNKLDVNGALAVGTYAGTNTATSGQLIVSGNVGIGTSAPGATLEVNGSVRASAAQGAFYASGHNGNAEYVGNWAASNFWGLGPLNNTDGTIQLGNTSSTTGTWNGTQNVNFVVGGNVGIGTTAVTNALTVVGNTVLKAATSGTTLAIQSSDGNNRFTFDTSSSTFCAGLFCTNNGIIKGGYDLTLTSRDSSNGGLILQAGGTGASSADNGIQFKISGTEQARFDTSGNLGIGTSTPQRTLDVTGTWGGNEYDRATDSISTTTTIADSTSGYLSYLLHANKTGGNNTTTTTYNLNGLPAVDGTFVFITVEGSHNASIGTSAKECVAVQINGIAVTNATAICDTVGSSASTVFESFVAARVNGTWMAMGAKATGTSLSQADLAEWIPFIGDQPEPGDILTTGGAINVEKSSTSYDSKVLGVVSTNPFQVMGEQTDQSVPLALTGRVPVHVSTINGPIHAGDAISASQISGYGMKATAPGTIIGKALEDFDTSSASTQTNDCPAGTTAGVTCGTITVLVGVSYNMPVTLTDTGDIQISPDTTTPGNYLTLDKDGNMIDNKESFSDATIANLTAGDISSSTLTSNNGSFTSLFSHAFNTDDLSVNNTISAGNITTTGIQYADFKLTEDLNNNLVIGNAATGSALLSLDNQGNATFSGTITAQGINAQNGTIGTLHVGNLIADNIQGMDQGVVNSLESTQASQSAAITGLSNKVDLNSNTLASVSAQLAQLENLNLAPFMASDSADTSLTTINNGLLVLGTASLGDTSVTSLSINNTLKIDGSSINSLGDTLSIESLKQADVNIMGGDVIIKTDGTLNVNQNAYFAKNITVGGEVMAASVSAQMINISKDQITNLSNTEVVASGSAGTLSVKAGETERIVFSNLLKPGALVYITPVSDTQGEAPFIDSQTDTQSSSSAYFRVKIAGPVTKDIKFNYLIIGQK